MKLIPTSIAFVLVLGACLAALGLETKEFVITGRTVDSLGKAAAGVRILAVNSQGGILGQTHSTDDGKYKLSASVDSGVIVSVFFDHPAYRPGLLLYVAVAATHSVDKVMLKPGEISDELSSDVEKAVRKYLESLSER